MVVDADAGNFKQIIMSKDASQKSGKTDFAFLMNEIINVWMLPEKIFIGIGNIWPANYCLAVGPVFFTSSANVMLLHVFHT